MDNLLLTDNEIREARAKAYLEGQHYGDDGEPLPEKEVAIAQHTKILQELKALVENIHPTGDIHGALKNLIKRMEKE